MMAAATTFDAAWAGLQKELDMVAHLLLGNLFLAYRPRLVLKDAETASTDGRCVVKMPRRFLDVGLEDGRPEIFLGLLAHEIGHWLQPMKEIAAVEKETGLMHDFVNIVIDVHCEHQAGLIFPLFKRPIKAMRELIGEKKCKSYRRDFHKAQDFVPAAGAALLYSRYCVRTELSFCPARFGIGTRGIVAHKNPAYDLNRLSLLLADVSTASSKYSGELPAFLRELAAKYPELCVPDLDFEDPLGGGSGGDEEPDLTGLLDIPDQEQSGVCSILECLPQGSTPPSPEVLALSRRLKNRWVAKAGAQSIMAPGRLDRMAALRGQPVPYAMRCMRPTRLKETGVRQIVLAADWSGSMANKSGDAAVTPWQAALAAAQAITLAMRSNGGDVRGLLFAQAVWHTPDYDAGTLFFTDLLGGGVSLQKANGSDTRFGWLPEVWQRFPDHQVLVLTDGAGFLPAYVPATCRGRTAALLIGLENYNADQQAEIRALSLVIAAKVVEVPCLDDLAGVWATLIPRRQVA